MSNCSAFLFYSTMKGLMAIILCFATFQLYAQDTGKLTGKVTDGTGEILIGAAVIYKTDVTIGSIADKQGIYELELPAGNARRGR